MSQPPPPRYETHPRVMLTEMGDGTGVLLHLDTKFYYTLNRTGVVVWSTLRQSGGDVQATCAEVTARFRVDEATARQDVADMLRELQREGLVRPLLER